MPKKKTADQDQPKAVKPKSTTTSKPKKAPPAKSAAAKSAASNAAPAKKHPKKPAAKPSASAAPRIDTSLAAAAAATMVGNRSVVEGRPSNEPAGEAQPKKESASFRHLKESFSKPGGGNLGGVLNVPQSQKKSNQNYGGGKQIGRNQTFGSDVNRSGVPRRTGG